jgi:hypothetical protein
MPPPPVPGRVLTEVVAAALEVVDDVAAALDVVDEVAAALEVVEDVAAALEVVDDVAAADEVVLDVAAALEVVDDVAAALDVVEDVAAALDVVDDDVAAALDVVLEDVAAALEVVVVVVVVWAKATGTVMARPSNPPTSARSTFAAAPPRLSASLGNFLFSKVDLPCSILHAKHTKPALGLSKFRADEPASQRPFLAHDHARPKRLAGPAQPGQIVTAID